MTRVAAVVLLAVLLAGCGGEDVAVLDEDQAEQALLSEDNLPGGFVVDPDDEESDASELGCLDALDEAEGPESESQADVTYSTVEGASMVSIGNRVESFTSVDAAVDSMDTGRQALTGCERVDETDEDGVRVEIDIELDDEASIDDADEQLNVSAVGRVSAQGVEIPITVWFSVVRIDNHVTMVSMADYREDPDSLVQPYLEIAVDRLTAVVAGDEPPATTGPGPGTAA